MVDPVTRGRPEPTGPALHDLCRRYGVTMLSSSHPEYPDRLRHLSDPPEPLFHRGALDALGHPCVAIVGSRKSTAYGRRVAETLSRIAARSGWTVVSGMALGIDGAAHRGTLEGGGLTVAVLGSGPERAYPRAHAGLMERILERGLVLSEHPPEVTPRAYHFPRRNRILAALATRVVVVEAAERSGALITAGIAADLGREVWAVPGSVFATGSRGTHALIGDGATPVTSMEAWAESLEPDLFTHGGAGAPDSGLPRGPARGLSARVWRALGGEPRTLEEVAESVGVDAREILSPLAALELGGWVRRAPGPSFFRAAS